jgi:hypothetical protein
MTQSKNLGVVGGSGHVHHVPDKPIEDTDMASKCRFQELGKLYLEMAHLQMHRVATEQCVKQQLEVDRTR